ncbi:hypothetical protein GJ496_009738 [Pomphorhynchus laevis]|nr:hypothetical protein GJ496_009738 [Pomphorhynchus laevis]
MTEGHSYRRINGSMINGFIGRRVCVLGYVSKVDRGSISIKACDGIEINVKFANNPVPQLSALNLVEVTGSVSNDRSIFANNIIIFSEEQAKDFDVQLYNQTITTVYNLADDGVEIAQM